MIPCEYNEKLQKTEFIIWGNIPRITYRSKVLRICSELFGVCRFLFLPKYMQLSLWYDTNLLVSRTVDQTRQTTQIKSTFELFCALLWNLARPLARPAQQKMTKKVFFHYSVMKEFRSVVHIRLGIMSSVKQKLDIKNQQNCDKAIEDCETPLLLRPEKILLS